jgi:hypothetical protein
MRQPISLKSAILAAGMLALSLLAVAGLASLTGLDAQAQAPPRGGGSPAGSTSEAMTTMSCHQSTRLVARSSDADYQINTSVYTPIPAAGLNMVFYPGTDCLIVTFSADVHSTDSTICQIRAMLNGVPISPASTRWLTNDLILGPTWVWAQSVTVSTQSTFLVRIEAAVTNGPAGATCFVDDWTLLVERRD